MVPDCPVRSMHMSPMILYCKHLPIDENDECMVEELLTPVVFKPSPGKSCEISFQATDTVNKALSLN